MNVPVRDGIIDLNQITKCYALFSKTYFSGTKFYNASFTGNLEQGRSGEVPFSHTVDCPKFFPCSWSWGTVYNRSCASLRSGRIVALRWDAHSDAVSPLSAKGEKPCYESTMSSMGSSLKPGSRLHHFRLQQGLAQSSVLTYRKHCLLVEKPSGQRPNSVKILFNEMFFLCMWKYFVWRMMWITFSLQFSSYLFF